MSISWKAFSPRAVSYTHLDVYKRQGECCGLKWKDVDFPEKSIHVCRNVVKVTGEDILVKEPKTAAGDRYVYFSLEMASLLKDCLLYTSGAWDCLGKKQP